MFTYFFPGCALTHGICLKKKLVANSYSLIDDFLSLLEGELNLDPNPVQSQTKDPHLDPAHIQKQDQAASPPPSVSDLDPEPDWIRIQSVRWIRIRLRMK
jgi:hypothetical protein